MCEHYQKRDQLRLVLDYRKKYLDLLLRGGEEEAKQAEADYEQARAQAEKDYEETVAALADKAPLTPDEEAELNRLWKKLVKLYHPDRFAHGSEVSSPHPGPLPIGCGEGEDENLTAAINRAKDTGDMAALREIAEDPHGFILRQGWASLDFTDEIELAQLRRLHETLQLEIVAVIESLNRLRESPDYEALPDQRAEARRAGGTGGGAGRAA